MFVISPSSSVLTLRLHFRPHRSIVCACFYSSHSNYKFSVDQLTEYMYLAKM